MPVWISCWGAGTGQNSAFHTLSTGKATEQPLTGHASPEHIYLWQSHNETSTEQTPTYVRLGLGGRGPAVIGQDRAGSGQHLARGGPLVLSPDEACPGL